MDERPVADHVGHARAERQDKTHVRLFRDNEERLERGLEHERHASGEQNAAVGHARLDQSVACAGNPRDRFDKGHADNAQHAARKHDSKEEHGEQTVRKLGLALAEGAGDDRAAARAEHEADRRNQHRDRKHDVDRAQRRVTEQIGYQKTVHNAVQRGENHHDDARQREAEQFCVCEVIGQFDLHGRKACLSEID